MDLIPSEYTNDPHAEKYDYKLAMTNKLRNAHEDIFTKRHKSVIETKGKYDKVHKDVQFEIGDLVFVFWPIPIAGVSRKLLPKWDGPFKIITKLGLVTYRVERLEGYTFAAHVKRLRKYVPYQRK